MRNFKNYLTPATCVVLTAAVLTLISPRRSEAQFASPVRVMNTSDGPALTRDVDNAARQPFSLTMSPHLINNSIGVSTGTANLAAGRRYVIESVSVYSLITKGTDPNWVATVSANSGGTFFSANFAVPNVLPGFNGGVQDIFAVTQPVHLTSDPNTSIGIGMQRVGSVGGGDVTFTLTGYSVTQ
jgi:hypothetical protein